MTRAGRDAGGERYIGRDFSDRRRSETWGRVGRERCAGVPRSQCRPWVALLIAVLVFGWALAGPGAARPPERRLSPLPRYPRQAPLIYRTAQGPDVGLLSSGAPSAEHIG